MPRTVTGYAPMTPLALYQAPGSRLGKMPTPTIPNKPLWYGARWHTQDPRPLPWKVQSRCRRDAALMRPTMLLWRNMSDLGRLRSSDERHSTLRSSMTQTGSHATFARTGSTCHGDGRTALYGVTSTSIARTVSRAQRRRGHAPWAPARRHRRLNQHSTRAPRWRGLGVAMVPTARR